MVVTFPYISLPAPQEIGEAEQELIKKITFCLIFNNAETDTKYRITLKEQLLGEVLIFDIDRDKVSFLILLPLELRGNVYRSDWLGRSMEKKGKLSEEEIIIQLI